MTGPTHVLLGTSTAFAAAEAAHLGATGHALLVGGAFLTSKLPDADMNLPGIRHRGPTHTLIALALVGVLVAVAASLLVPEMAAAIAAGALVGYGAHLLADACTPHGVPLFAPLYAPDVHLLPRRCRIRTGSGAESLLGLVVIGLLAWYAIGVYG